jgi:hypothetical protein
MTSVSHRMPPCSLFLEATFYSTPDGYWGFAHQFPLHARGATLQDCMDTLCTNLQILLTAGKRVVHHAVLATADATIVVDNPYTAPVCVVELCDPAWPRQRRRMVPASGHGG